MSDSSRRRFQKVVSNLSNMASPEDIRYALFQQGIWTLQEYLESIHKENLICVDEAFKRSLCMGTFLMREENNMETRNVKLTLEQAKEFYKKGGDLRTIALTAFTEGELCPLPRSWEEFCLSHKKKDGEVFIGRYSGIEVRVGDGDRCDRTDRNVLPSEEAGKAHLALMQLHQLRDCYRQGWVPDWDDLNQEKYCIVAIGERQCKTIKCARAKHFLSFQSQELAGKFLQCFVHEIYQARELL